MKKLTISTAIVLAITGILYFTGSFISLSFLIKSWSEDLRMTIGILWCMLSIVGFLISFIIQSVNE